MIVPWKYQGKKKNIKENDFLVFNFNMKNNKKLSIIKVSYKFMHFKISYSLWWRGKISEISLK